MQPLVRAGGKTVNTVLTHVHGEHSHGLRRIDRDDFHATLPRHACQRRSGMSQADHIVQVREDHELRPRRNVLVVHLHHIVVRHLGHI